MTQNRSSNAPASLIATTLISLSKALSQETRKGAPGRGIVNSPLVPRGYLGSPYDN